MSFVENKNAPSVRFVRIRGRIIPIVGGQKSAKAAKVLQNNIDEMNVQVEIAEAGRRFTTQDGEWLAQRSSFPKFFGKLGFKKKDEWLRAIKKGEGRDFDIIRDHAAAQTNFKLATKQLYDNHNVLFRNIGGIVRPIRAKSSDAYEFFNWKATKAKEELPF